RDFGVRDPDAMFRVLQVSATSSSGQWPLADAAALVGRPALSTLAVSVSGGGATLGSTTAGEPSVGFIEFTGPGFFALMGGRTAIGRTLGPADDAPGDVPAVVLGHAYWSRRMGEDPGAVGRVLWLNGL